MAELTSSKRRHLGLKDRPRSRRGLALLAGGVVLLEMAGAWIRGRRLAGNLVVRCGRDHLFTTIWIPGASVKSLRFGWWRLQRCPVGRHWTIVTPVNQAELGAEQRRQAAAAHDIRVP